MTRQIFKLHESSDHYHTKQTYCRIIGRKKYVIQTCSFFDKNKQAIYENMYVQYLQNANILADSFLLPYKTKSFNDQFFIFSNFVQLHLDVSIYEAFELLKKANKLLSSVNFNALRLYAEEKYLPSAYYSNENVIPIYADCHPGNICIHDSKLKFIDIDSIVMLERKHSFDEFAFEWLVMNPCKDQPMDWIVDRALSFIKSHILPNLSNDYATFDDFLADFVLYSLGQVKKLMNEQQFDSHKHLSNVSRAVLALKAAKNS